MVELYVTHLKHVPVGDAVVQRLPCAWPRALGKFQDVCVCVWHPVWAVILSAAKCLVLFSARKMSRTASRRHSARNEGSTTATWGGFSTAAAFSKWGQYLQYGIPAMLMISLEWW